MRGACPAVFLLSLAIQCSAQTLADPQYEGSLGPASYSEGYVLDWDFPAYTHVVIYGPDTKPLYSSDLRGGEGRFYNVWAIDSDATGARAYQWHGNRKTEGRIELLDRDGNLTQTIRTGPYISNHMAFAGDHTLWTIGYENRRESQTEDFNVLHHYAQNGEEISQGLPWLHIAGDYNAYTSLQPCLGGKKIYVANDRIGFNSNLYAGHGSWIEISPDGNLLGKYDLGTYRELSYQPEAMTASGTVYARIFKEDRFNGWAVLDRQQHQWLKVSGYPKGVIIGSDGDNIVFSQHDGGWTVLHSVPYGSLRSQVPKQGAETADLRE